MAWLLSDLTSIFTTATGGANAVPGDPVGLILDISKMGGMSAAAYMAANGIADPNACPGTHFRQATAGARPIFARFPKSGVRNKMVWTSNMRQAGWQESTGDVPVAQARHWKHGVTFAPDGKMTGNKLVESTDTDQQRIYLTVVTINGNTYTYSVYAKKADYRYFQLRTTARAGAIFDLEAGIFEDASGIQHAQMIDVGDGWYRCSIRFVSNPTGNVEVPWLQLLNDAKHPSWAGDGTKGTYFWGNQFEDGELTPYQRVTNAYDVVEAPYAHCYALVGDGLSKCMVSDAVTPNSDKVTAFAAVRKLSDTTTGMVLEASANAGGNSAIYLSASNTGIALYGMLSRGTAVASAFSSGTYPAPHSAILTGIGDIANDICRTRINGLQVASSVADQGSGNYGTHPLFLLARNQSSLFFNGYWFGGAIRWSAMPDADRAFVERLLAKNTMQVTL